jgi:hypothetical protein
MYSDIEEQRLYDRKDAKAAKKTLLILKATNLNHRDTENTEKN